MLKAIQMELATQLLQIFPGCFNNFSAFVNAPILPLIKPLQCSKCNGNLFLEFHSLKKKPSSLNYHFDRRRDFPEPGPPDTSRGGIGAGAATRSFRRSKYYKKRNNHYKYFTV